MKKIFIVSFIIFALVNPALSDDDYQAVLINPPKITIDKELYKIEIEPISILYSEGWGPKSFKLVVSNLKSKNFEISWDATYYLKNGKVDGIFCEYKGKTQLKTESIPSAQSIERNIAPENLSKTHLTPHQFFKTGSWWYHKELPVGRNGIMIKMMIEGKEYTESAEFDFITK